MAGCMDVFFFWMAKGDSKYKKANIGKTNAFSPFGWPCHLSLLYVQGMEDAWVVGCFLLRAGNGVVDRLFLKLCLEQKPLHTNTIFNPEDILHLLAEPHKPTPLTVWWQHHHLTIAACQKELMFLSMVTLARKKTGNIDSNALQYFTFILKTSSVI